MGFPKAFYSWRSRLPKRVYQFMWITVYVVRTFVQAGGEIGWLAGWKRRRWPPMKISRRDRRGGIFSSSQTPPCTYIYLGGWGGRGGEGVGFSRSLVSFLPPTTTTTAEPSRKKRTKIGLEIVRKLRRFLSPWAKCKCFSLTYSGLILQRCRGFKSFESKVLTETQEEKLPDGIPFSLLPAGGTNAKCN